MVIGSNWKNVHLICGNHTKEDGSPDYSNELYMREGAVGMSSFYACPKYISELRPENNIDGRSCFNRLGTTDFMKMISIVDEERYPDDGQKVSIKGFKFKIKRIEFKVIEEKGDELWIVVLNKKTIQV